MPRFCFAAFAYFASWRETALFSPGLTRGFTALGGSGLKSSDGVKQGHRHERPERVDAAVFNGGGPARHETLVVLIRQ